MESKSSNGMSRETVAQLGNSGSAVKSAGIWDPVKQKDSQVDWWGAERKAEREASGMADVYPPSEKYRCFSGSWEAI